MSTVLRNYLLITASYWAFTVTDGAIRMLVVLYFHRLGYTPLDIAFLFLFYEVFGIVTNLLGGWLASRIGLNVTLHLGMAMQVAALLMLTVPDARLTVPWVMAAQALSGIAKDLSKMSAKAGVRLMLPADAGGRLFRWVAVLTGSKNALKGFGFFLGGWLLAVAGFRQALLMLAGALALALAFSLALLPRGMGRSPAKTGFSRLFSRSGRINRLAAARFFLFGARDVWFVVGLPVYLAAQLDWSAARVGALLAAWIIGYGVIQGLAPKLLRHHPDARTARRLVGVLLLVPTGMALSLGAGLAPVSTLLVGLASFALVFALNSAVHSFLVLEWSAHEEAAVNVGFYYMANAGGRLTGTVLSGWAYQQWGLIGCLWWSAAFLLVAGWLTGRLSRAEPATAPV